jgi:hypothetical protein
VDDGARGPLLRLAVSEPDGHVLARRNVDVSEFPAGRYGLVHLAFELTRPTVLDFPIAYLGGARVLLDRLDVTLEPAASPGPLGSPRSASGSTP